MADVQVLFMDELFRWFVAGLFIGAIRFALRWRSD